MSKLSEDLECVLRNTLSGLSSSSTGLLRSAELGTLDKEFPGFPAWNLIARAEATALLRSAKFKFAGAEPWKSGMEALDHTTDAVQDKAMQLQMRSLAAGYQIGFGQELRGLSNEEYSAMFKDGEFQKPIDLMTWSLSLDKDAMSLLYDHLACSIKAFADMFGLLLDGVAVNTRVWDVWSASLSSNALAMYMAGIQVGSKWAEEEILEGIKMATSQHEES